VFNEYYKKIGLVNIHVRYKLTLECALETENHTK